jgi:hypothetical protein
MIAPNRRNRSRSQDGRQLRGYRKHWKVGRLFAWMHNFRRLVTRWEPHIENFLASSTLPAFTCCSDIYETTSAAYGFLVRERCLFPPPPGGSLRTADLRLPLPRPESGYAPRGAAGSH